MSVQLPLKKAYTPYLNLLPNDSRSKAEDLVEKLKPTVNIADRVMYEDGTIGSNIVDLLKYYVMPEAYERPVDYHKFVKEKPIEWIEL